MKCKNGDKNDGGPAFPQSEKTWVMGSAGNSTTPVHKITGGMTLRDYFAAKVMQALAGAIATEDECGIIHNMPNDIAGIAYTYADAMLDEREKHNEQ